MLDEIQIQESIPASFLSEAVHLFNQAFEPKLALAVKDEAKRIALLKDSFCPGFGICALSDDKLFGLVGLLSTEGSLVQNLTVRKIFQHLGFLAGVRAAVAFTLFESRAKETELWIDFIAVSEDARGMGIGTKLLAFVKKHAQAEGYKSVKLDVIDINDKARRLYEREGFVPVKTEKYGLFRGLLGFGGSTTMVFQVDF